MQLSFELVHLPQQIGIVTCLQHRRLSLLLYQINSDAVTLTTI